MKLVFAFCAALVSIGCVSVGAQPRGGDRFVLFENNAPRPPRAIPHVRAHQAALVPVPRPRPNARPNEAAADALPAGFPPVAPLE